MMAETGWIGEGPDAGPAMPVTERMLAMRQRGPGDALEMALARSRADDARQARDEAAGARDPDEYAANLVTRGYMPGQISQLSMRLADTVAELADEEAKIEKAARRAERIRQMHERGQISGFDILARMADDTDEGDEARVSMLQRRAESIRRQIGEANEAITPPSQRAPEDLLAPAKEALAGHLEYVAASRAAWSAAQAGAPQRERRPFASRGGGVAARSEHCVYCTADGVTDEQSYLLHSDPEYNVPVTTPEQAQQAEVNRLQALGYSAETAQLAARPNDDGMAVR